jgi:branched-chain amino acid aminotransferase
VESIIYFNGAFRPESECTVSVRSRGLNYGLGCFAGIRGYRTDDGNQVNVFRLDRHVRRLEQSARILRLRMSGPPDEVAGLILELLRRNEMRADVYVRPIVFANSNELSPVLDPDACATAIYCLPLGRYLSPDPIDVCVSSWRRVREAAIPAREGCLISPPSTADNLDGITRQSLFVLAREDLGIPCVERPIGRTELYVADEMFLCGTGAEITAVRSVDRRMVGDGTIGPITQRLSQRFEAVVRGRVAARMEWLTPVW